MGSRRVATPSAARGGPGSSSQNSSASTRTRKTSPWSMYMRSATGVSRSALAPVMVLSGSQKCARSFGSLSTFVSVCKRGGGGGLQCTGLREVCSGDVDIIEEAEGDCNASLGVYRLVYKHTHVEYRPRPMTSLSPE